MRTLLAVVLSAALAPVALAGEATPTSTRVDVEVFTVGIADASGQAIAFARVQGELTRGENPDGRSKELAGQSAKEIVLIHSTSWRWEPDGRIVLTYVAWAKDGALKPGFRALPKLSPPGPTDPLHPRPAEIRELAPLAHGLRHLAFLLRTSKDGAVATALGTKSTAMLKKLEPDVAGELEASQ